MMPPMLRRLLTTAFLFAILPLHAHAETDPACAAAGLHEIHCRDPLLGEWGGYRYVIGERIGPLRATQDLALADALNQLGSDFPCGLTHVSVSNPVWKTSGELWSWPTREDAVSLQYIGFNASIPKTCGGNFEERSGAVTLRRERKVICPKDFSWIVRDNSPGLCVRD